MTTAKRRATPSSAVGQAAQSPDQPFDQPFDQPLASPTRARPASALMPGTSGAASALRDGRVEVSAHAIATIAAQAATECYGVAGIASRRPRLGAVQRLAPADYARGVEVRFAQDHVVIDLWLILEHSLRVVEVAHNVMVIVKYAVEQALGLHVVEVNVNVQALRVHA
ncbi:MAG TPA: Asp23/Gls24 family envelope stress response protein [Ktedonobacterales bacterium]